MSAPARSTCCICTSPTIAYALPVRLPIGVTGIGSRKLFSDVDAVAIGHKGAGEVALGLLHVADLLVRHRQVALPSGVAGIGCRQPFIDGEAVAVGLERAREVALRHLHIANIIVRNRASRCHTVLSGSDFAIRP